MATILTSKPQRYPYGWMTAQGLLNNHNSYDIATLLSCAYSNNALTPAEKQSWVAPCQNMLGFAVNSSSSMSQPEKCFEMSSFYTSLGDAYYFGSSALTLLGYFGSTPPFWANTTQPDPSLPFYWPSNRTVCCDAIKCLNATGLPENLALDALQRLQAGCPGCLS